MSSPRGRGIAALTTVMAAIAAVPARAQTAPPAQTGDIQEIIVTARKRVESSQNVPITVNVFTAQEIQDDAKALVASPGNNNLVQGKNFAVVLTVETGKSAKEFEWHEKRDHILQVLDGSTIYEVGGTPKGAHSEAAGEWHAPEAVGATTLTLKKGDMLVIPRGTLHKRSTAGTVTFTLISPQ